MGKNKKNFLTREEQENLEKLPSQDTEVPASRFQPKQQTPDAASAEKTSVDNGGFAKKKVQSNGSVLKQEVAARVVDTGVGGEIPEAALGTRSLSYGGNDGTILDSAAYTPIAGQSRSDSRMGKKLDAVAKKINFVPSEQVEEQFDESKPLAEDKSAVQGYNGSPRNVNARSQKNNGFVPGELLYQRSLDEIKREQLYFSTGQVVRQTSGGTIDFQDTPTIVPTLNSNGVYTYGEEANYSLNRGNYLHRGMRIKFNAQGQLTQMTFDTLDISSLSTDSTVINDSSANATIDMNHAEMNRQVMDAKAGDESQNDNWSPLPRAIKQPTRTIGYLRDIENITGSEIFLAYKKTALAHSYQLNRASKDGLNIIRPMAEAALGLVTPERTSKYFDTMTTGDIFNVDQYKRGASSLFIAIYDSVTKYNNKADLLTQPRSFKLALQTADNNMNPFHLKSDLVKVINSREVFSTIDREYDPLQPVEISDREALIHCYNFNDLYSFESLDAHGQPVFAKNPFKYMYTERRNDYVVTAALPLLRGLHQYLNSVGPKIVSLGGSSHPLVDNEIYVPMTHSTCFFSLWSLFILSATPFILRERVQSLRDVLYYEKNFEYPFDQLISIKDANPMNAVNYGNTDYQMPISVKRMTPATALTWVLPEMFIPIDEQSADDTYSYLLPWYFNQVDFNFTGTSINRAAGHYSMSYPSVRSGVRFGYLDDIYGMSERDVRLALDRLTDIPKNIVGAGNQGVYKYSQNNDGIPYVTIRGDELTLTKFLSLPRELGWFIVAPAGTLSLSEDATDDNAMKFATGNTPMFGQTSYIAKYWHGTIPAGNNLQPTAILAKTSINVNRASAYTQDWNVIPATNLAPNTYDEDWGFYLSLRDALEADGSLISGRSKFIPFTDGVIVNGAEGIKTDSQFEMMSLQKALWTRVQKLPMAISPWDARLHRKVGEDAIKIDPFDFLYYFGLAGFKASEYDEDVYNRMSSVLNLGFQFLEDPFCQDSSLFKEAGSYTQSNNNASLIK